MWKIKFIFQTTNQLWFMVNTCADLGEKSQHFTRALRLATSKALHFLWQHPETVGVV
jgi:hypothetical protein